MVGKLLLPESFHDDAGPPSDLAACGAPAGRTDLRKPLCDRTYLDLSELLPPLAYSIVLAFFGLGGVFATLGIFCAICGWLTWRYLPKTL